jgi:hypothetical protein
MQKNMDRYDGLQRFIEKQRQLFRIPENLNFYSERDFHAAERKFLKFVLINGKVASAGQSDNIRLNGSQ